MTIPELTESERRREWLWPTHTAALNLGFPWLASVVDVAIEVESNDVVRPLLANAYEVMAELRVKEVQFEAQLPKVDNEPDEPTLLVEARVYAFCAAVLRGPP